MSGQLSIPFIQRFADKLVYIRYSPTLTQILHINTYKYLLSLLDGKRVVFPLYGYYRRVNREEHYTVIGFVKVALGEAEPGAKLYVLEPMDEELIYAGKILHGARLVEQPDNVLEALRDQFYEHIRGNPRAIIEVKNILREPEYVEYLAPNGKQYILVKPKGLIIGRVIDGFKILSNIAFIVGEQIEDISLGDRLEAVYLYSKSGRTVFYETKTSSQVNYYITLPE